MTVAYTKKLVPSALKAKLPLSADLISIVNQQRLAIKQSLSCSGGLAGRLLVIIGPCSIHDPAAAMDYAKRLAAAADKHKSELLIAMRVYIEKPRTTVGWKGLVHDPKLTQSQCLDGLALDTGLHTSREIMVRVAELGLPVVTEILSPLVVPFLDDVIALGVIGARTTESQTHRELASHVPFPVGFKNGTDGSLSVAIDAIQSAERQHTLLNVGYDGTLVQTVSPGNPDTFVVLRGGKNGPNYSPEHVRQARNAMTKAGKPVRLVVDCSHGNSYKDYRNQAKVAASVGKQVALGGLIAGVMIESNIRPGRQDIPDTGLLGLEYGVSVTDGCVGWDETEVILQGLAASVRARRKCNSAPAHLDLAETTSATETIGAVVNAIQTSHVRRLSFHHFLEKEFRPPITTTT